MHAKTLPTTILFLVSMLPAYTGQPPFLSSRGDYMLTVLQGRMWSLSLFHLLPTTLWR